MRQARWEEGSKIGQPVFTPAVALSIMVFFALWRRNAVRLW